MRNKAFTPLVSFFSDELMIEFIALLLHSRLDRRIGDIST
jgi:hypothetical protein